MTDKEPTDKNTEDDFTFARREVIVGSVLATIGSTLGISPESVAAQNTVGSSIDDIKRQYDTDITELSITHGTDEDLMSIRGQSTLNIPDNQITGTLELAVNRDLLGSTIPDKITNLSKSERFNSQHDGRAGTESGIELTVSKPNVVKSDFEEIGSATVQTTAAYNEGYAAFGGPDHDDSGEDYFGTLWSASENVGTNEYPLHNNSAIWDGSGSKQKYGNIGVVEKSQLSGHDLEGVPRNRNKFELRFRIGSTNG